MDPNAEDIETRDHEPVEDTESLTIDDIYAEYGGEG